MNTKNVQKFEKGVYMQVNPINCLLADQCEFARRVARFKFFDNSEAFHRKNVKHFQEYLAGREESDGLHGKLEMLGEYSSVDGMNI